MEDEAGVKAPVTRLRRRLSVEHSDDAKSSSAPNTPTKKKGGRRVAKPELDLIDENAPENDNPKKLTKKTNMKDLEIEEKPVTPSRRSARIKSNTSIVLETTQAIDSPRAKRASRRNSQVGSDNETPLTPARHTRRTRKDSTNADKGEPQIAIKPTVPINEIIIEEPENSLQKAQSEKPIEQSQSPSGLRKSPRLSLKKNKKIDLTDQTDKESSKSEKLDDSTVTTDSTEKAVDKSEEHNNSNKENEASNYKEGSENNVPLIKLVDVSHNLVEVENNKLSVSNIELLNGLNTKPKKINLNLNKSSSALIDTQTKSFKHKRHRTKSWADLSEPVRKDDKYYSDSESTRKKKSILLNNSNNSNAQNVAENSNDSLNSSSSNKMKNTHNESIKDVCMPANMTPTTNDPIYPVATNLFDKEPTNELQALVYIEESDSNSDKINIHGQAKDEDQCVPIMQTHLNCQETSLKEEKVSKASQENEDVTDNKNNSCEPMDIDETIPDVISNKSLLKQTDMSENKILLNINDELSCTDNKKNKSRKSSLNANTSQPLDKTANENKSTLVLSQLKDTSNEKYVQSPSISNEKMLPNSDHALNFTQENEIDKKNISINCLTSTPLQQRNLIKHPIQINTSGITRNNTSEVEKSYSKLHVSSTNKSNNKSEESESGDESSGEENNFVDDEAEDAGDDYESGDSRDTEDERYEKEHEIIQKGETLTSEDELSNDTDYEKDSFVVSSDQEDDDLLDGSGDDLTMSDKELKMTAGSKKKYNERMMKEQKKASREMFASRHKLNVSSKSSESAQIKTKKNRAILDSSDSEDDNVQKKIKRNKRMRLDSSHEPSMSLDDISTNELNESLPNAVRNENGANEVEMTIVDDMKSEIDPLSIDIKNEPKTPEKGKINTSIQFIDPEHYEKKIGDGDKSQIVDDPLEESNQSSDSSNNEHIQNYDSVLDELNKTMKTKKNKKGDISLNIGNKPKKKLVSVVDHLNLTQVKSKAKKQKEMPLGNSIVSSLKESIDKTPEGEVVLKNKNRSLNDTSNKSVSNNKFSNDDSDESSASINLHLLFSEDSNNSEDVELKKAGKSKNNVSLIPLHESHVKTGAFETTECDNTLSTDSAKKMKKKNKSLNKSDVDIENSADETEVQFFLDTTGTHNSTAVDKSIDISGTKKKKGKHTVIEHEDSDSDAPIEVSNRSVIETQQELINTSLAELNKSKTKAQSNKKKKRTESLTKEQADTTENQSVMENDNEMEVNQSGTTDKSINNSISKTAKSSKKKAKKMSECETADEKDKNSDMVDAMEVSKKGVKEAHAQYNDEEVSNISLTVSNKSITKTPKSDKKKKRTSESQTKEQSDAIENIRNEDHMESKDNFSDIANQSINKSVLKTPKSDKKKVKRISESQAIGQKSVDISASNLTPKNKSAMLDQDIEDNIEDQEHKTEAEDKLVNKSVDKTPKSGKKKKTSETPADIPTDTITNKTTSKSSSSEKKKLKKLLVANKANDLENNTQSELVVDSKKRKRKSSLDETEKELESEDVTPSFSSQRNTSLSMAISSQTKKRKISHKNKDLENLKQVPSKNTKIPLIEEQNNQDKNQRHPLEVNNKIEITDVGLNIKKGSYKRKEREDDEESKMAKVLKVESNNKIKVPRLPASVVNQLEDKAAKKTLHVTKAKAISTTNFVVEESKVRKTKPSTYLEESIYLNEKEVLESKKVKRIKNPKVLPFLPTVSTSSCGFTTNFRVNVLPKEIQFVAKSTSVNNFKNDYLQNKKNKRLGTYELYKKNRAIKMSKF